jgi:hypothetical protein
MIFLLIAVNLFSCNDEDRQQVDEFRFEIYNELTAESDLFLMDETVQKVNKYRTRNKRRNFSGLDAYHQKLDSTLALYNMGKSQLIDTAVLKDFEQNYLTLRFNYESAKGSYSYPEKGEDLSTLNVTDTADFVKNKELLGFILNTELSAEIRQLHLTELISQCMTFYSNQIPWNSDFYSIELMPNAKQNIWIKGEHAPLVIDYYCVDANAHTKVKIAGHIFDSEPIKMKAPLEKGLYNFEGIYYVKEMGIEVEKSFTYRILVE